MDESMEMSIEISSASEANITTTTTDNADTSLLDAYNEDESLSIRSKNNNSVKQKESFTSPSPNFSSPYMTADEMKKRLVATREAFQKSLEAQKSRLRSNYFDQEDSFVFDSDLSIDSLKSTKTQIEKIKKEINELIESDIEELEKHSKHEVNLLNTPPLESIFVSILKYLLIFSITSIIFTFIFINYTPVIKIQYKKYLEYLEFIETVNVLEKIEEFLNFILQDD